MYPVSLFCVLFLFHAKEHIHTLSLSSPFCTERTIDRFVAVRTRTRSQQLFYPRNNLVASARVALKTYCCTCAVTEPRAAVKYTGCRISTLLWLSHVSACDVIFTGTLIFVIRNFKPVRPNSGQVWSCAAVFCPPEQRTEHSCEILTITVCMYEK
jgi:hypothetical protein